ncbi:MAG: hypothetical protein ACHQEB_05990, partial [Chitinophagales bacterium]
GLSYDTSIIGAGRCDLIESGYYYFTMIKKKRRSKVIFFMQKSGYHFYIMVCFSKLVLSPSVLLK